MRLSIPSNVNGGTYVCIQTRVVELRFACRDERCCLRPTNGHGRREMYCPQCEHQYGKGLCLFARPDRVAERAAERVVLSAGRAVGPTSPDVIRQRRRERAHSQDRVCREPGCSVHISDDSRSGYCKSHAAQHRRTHWRYERPKDEEENA